MERIGGRRLDALSNNRANPFGGQAVHVLPFSIVIIEAFPGAEAESAGDAWEGGRLSMGPRQMGH